MKVYGIRNVNGDIKEVVGQIIKRIRVYEEIAEKVTTHFQCHRCDNCCKMPVNINDDDLERLLEKLGDSVMAVIDSTDCGCMEIKAPCFFHDDEKGCRIYDIKPGVCRRYPFSSEYMMCGVCLCPMGIDIADAFDDYFCRPLTSKSLPPPVETFQAFIDNVHDGKILPEKDPENLMARYIIPLPMIIEFERHLSEKKGEQ